MEESDSIHSVDALVWRIYRTALNVSLRHFREHALKEVGRLTPVDAVLWGGGEPASDRFHTFTVSGSTDELAHAVGQGRSFDPMFGTLIPDALPEVDTVSPVSTRRYRQTDLHRRLGCPLGLRHSLAAMYRGAETGLYSLIVLLRRDDRPPFTALERRRLQHVFYHLMHALTMSYSVHLSRTPMHSEEGGVAVCDSRGICHDAQPAFRTLLGSHFAAWDGLRLPFPVPEAGARAPARHGRLRVAAKPVADLFSVEVWPEGPMDRLTEREREIVTSVCRGLSYKEVARPLGIAPSTVSNHVYRVFDKLGVTSRTELAKLVSRR